MLIISQPLSVSTCVEAEAEDISCHISSRLVCSEEEVEADTFYHISSHQVCNEEVVEADTFYHTSSHQVCSEEVVEADDGGDDDQQR